MTLPLPQNHPTTRKRPLPRTESQIQNAIASRLAGDQSIRARPAVRQPCQYGVRLKDGRELPCVLGDDRDCAVCMAAHDIESVVSGAASGWVRGDECGRGRRLGVGGGVRA
jgi:hypothetical protein